MKKQLLVFTICLISFLGCQKEELQYGYTENQQQVEFLKLKVSVFKSDSIVRANNKLNGVVTSKFLETNNNFSRLVKSSSHGFFIDTSQVQLFESDFYESYTFRVYREQENPNILENYIITFYEDGSYFQNVIAYPKSSIDDSWDFANATGIRIDDEDLLSRNFNDCGTDEIAMTEWGS